MCWLLQYRRPIYWRPVYRFHSWIRLFHRICIRFHPQSKCGSQVFLCGRRLKGSQKSENVPNRSKNRPFSKDRSFTVRGLFVQKSVFLTHHVVHSIRVNWKSERSLNFSSSRMPWLYRPKNLYGALYTVTKVVRNPCVVVVVRPYFAQRFLIVAHT